MSHRLHSNTISAKNPTHFRVSTAGTALPFHLTATDKINLLARMRSKGRNTRERGWYHEKGKRKASLSLTGLREAKRPEDGTPCPFFLSGPAFCPYRYGLSHQASLHVRLSFTAHVSAGIGTSHDLAFEPHCNALGRLSFMGRWDGAAIFGRIGKTRSLP